MSSQPTPRQFLRKAALVGLCGGILLSTVTACVEAYDAAYAPNSGHGGLSLLLLLLVRAPAFYFLTALRLDDAFTTTTHFGQSAVFVIANGICVVTIVMAFAVILVLCGRALDHDNRAA